MANIQVTVTTTPAEDRIEALLESAKQTKAYADAIKAKTQPIIDCAGTAKFHEIVRQLDEWLEKARRVFELTGDWEHTWCFSDVVLRSFADGKMYFTCSGVKIHEAEIRGYLPYLLGEHGLVADWNQDKVIERLDKQLETELRRFVENQKASAESATNTLKKILG